MQLPGTVIKVGTRPDTLFLYTLETENPVRVEEND
jgi:hypothetical protein